MVLKIIMLVEYDKHVNILIVTPIYIIASATDSVTHNLLNLKSRYRASNQ